MHGNNVDSTTLLGDSEVLAVKHTPRHAIPEFVQRLEYDREVSSSVAREKAMHVFEDNGSWHAASNKPHKLVKQSRLPTAKPRSRPHSRKTEVLTRESCCPNIGMGDVFMAERPYVVHSWDVGPVLREDIEAKGFDLTLKYCTKSCPLKS